MTPSANRYASRRMAGAYRQRGATLIIGLIMLVLITLIVVNAFMLSSSNLKSVGNMQVREEAVAAGNLAIEQVISTEFWDPLIAQEINIDINKDGINDYLVKVEIPECIKTLIASTPGNTQIGFNTGGAASGTTWNTEWDINASVTDTASGASVRIRQGVRVRLDEGDKNDVCP